jgi:hypothetical protein
MQIDLETYETQRIPSASHFLFSSAGSKRRFISQRWQGREFFASAVGTLLALKRLSAVVGLCRITNMFGLDSTERSSKFEASYLKLFDSGELDKRVHEAHRRLANCDLCARYCHVNRLVTIEGAVCRTGERAVLHSFGAHHGEEDVLRGWNGSGTMFFSSAYESGRQLRKDGNDVL